MQQKRKKTVWKTVVRQRELFIMIIPVMIYVFIFHYWPLSGWQMAFQNFKPNASRMAQEWVGFDHFKFLFEDERFFRVMRNTLAMSVINLVFGFVSAIFLSLMMNEVKNLAFKRVVQTISYLPHFLSWSVLVGLVYLFVGPTGVVSTFLRSNDMRGLEIITDPNWFRPLIVLELIWKEAGWGTIIYLAALSGVDEQIYEAAVIDGAGRFHQLWHITLPAIRSTIIILLILRMGTFMDTGFEQIFLMRNSLNRQVAEVFDTYVYVRGVREGYFSYATAVGLFKSCISLVLVLGTNKLAGLFGEEGVF